MDHLPNQSQLKGFLKSQLERVLKFYGQETKPQVTQRQNKTSGDCCSNCGHARGRHLFGAGACTCTQKHDGAGWHSCHCRSFNSVAVSVGEINSVVTDRRDNRDPLSDELTTFTRLELVKLRGVGGYRRTKVSFGEVTEKSGTITFPMSTGNWNGMRKMPLDLDDE